MNNLKNQLNLTHSAGTFLIKKFKELSPNTNFTDLSLESIMELQKEVENKQIISKRQLKKRINSFLNNNSKPLTFTQNLPQSSTKAFLGLNGNKLIERSYKGIKLENINKQILTTKIPVLKNNLNLLENNKTIINQNSLKATQSYSNTYPMLWGGGSEIIMSKNKLIKTITPFDSNFASNNTIMYNFNKQNNKKITGNINNIYTILESSFLNMSSLISKPIFFIQPESVKIHLFFYWKPLKNKFTVSNLNSKFLILNREKLQSLVEILSAYFNKPVELDITRIYYPHFDSNILANFIGLISNIIKFRFISSRLFFKAKIKNPTKRTKKIRSRIITSFLSGINIKTAGRIMAKRTKNRIKSKTIQKGSLARTKATLVNTSRFTNKNKTGAFSITVKTGHIILD